MLDFSDDEGRPIDVRDEQERISAVLRLIPKEAIKVPDTYTEAVTVWGRQAMKTDAMNVKVYAEASPAELVYWLSARFALLSDQLLSSLKQVAVRVTGDAHAACALNAGAACDHEDASHSAPIFNPFSFDPPLVMMMDNSVCFYVKEITGMGPSRDKDTWCKAIVMTDKEARALAKSPALQGVNMPVGVTCHMGRGEMSLNLSRMIAAWPLCPQG